MPHPTLSGLSGFGTAAYLDLWGLQDPFCSDRIVAGPDFAAPKGWFAVDPAPQKSLSRPGRLAHYQRQRLTMSLLRKERHWSTREPPSMRLGGRRGRQMFRGCR